MLDRGSGRRHLFLCYFMPTSCSYVDVNPVLVLQDYVVA